MLNLPDMYNCYFGVSRETGETSRIVNLSSRLRLDFLWLQKATAEHSNNKLQATPNSMYAIGISKTVLSSVKTSGVALSSLITEKHYSNLFIKSI